MAKVIKSVPFIHEQKDEKTKTTVEFFKWIGYMVLLRKFAYQFMSTFDKESKETAENQVKAFSGHYWKIIDERSLSQIIT